MVNTTVLDIVHRLFITSGLGNILVILSHLIHNVQLKLNAIGAGADEYFVFTRHFGE